MGDLKENYKLSLKIGETINSLKESNKIILLDKLILSDPNTLWPKLQLALGIFDDKILSIYVISPTKKPTLQKGIRKMLTPLIFNSKDEFRDMLIKEFDRSLINLKYEKPDKNEFTNPFLFNFHIYNDLIFRSRNEKELNIIRPNRYNEKPDNGLGEMFMCYGDFLL